MQEDQQYELCNGIETSKPTNPLDSTDHQGVVGLKKLFLVLLEQEGFVEGPNTLIAAETGVALLDCFNPKLTLKTAQILHLLYRRHREFLPNEHLSPTRITAWLLKDLVRPLLVKSHPQVKTTPGVLEGTNGLDDILKKVMSLNRLELPLSNVAYLNQPEYQAFRKFEKKVVADQLHYGLVTHFQLFTSISEKNACGWHKAYLDDHVHSIYELHRLFVELEQHYLPARIPCTFVDAIKNRASKNDLLVNNISKTQEGIFRKLFQYHTGTVSRLFNTYVMTFRTEHEGAFLTALTNREISSSIIPRTDDEKIIYTLLGVNDPVIFKGTDLLGILMKGYKDLAFVDAKVDPKVLRPQAECDRLRSVFIGLVIYHAKNEAVCRAFLTWIRSQEFSICRYMPGNAVRRIEGKIEHNLVLTDEENLDLGAKR